MPKNDKPRTKRRLRLVTARVALAAGTVVLMFFVFEAALRVTGSKPQTATVLTSYFRFDPSTGWIGQPNAASRFVTTNFDARISHGADGLRSCGLETTIDEDCDFCGEVIWCLGDSGTWGWGVDDGKTYVDRLNQMDAGKRVYRNLGMCGYSSVQQYLLLRKKFEETEPPDAVVILFCGNDLYENMDDKSQDPPRAYCEVVDGEVELRNLPVPPSTGWNARAWLKRHSLAYNYLHFYITSAKKQLSDRAKARRAAEASVASQAASAQSTDAAKAAAPPKPEPEYIVLRDIYSRIKEICDEHGVRMIVSTEPGVDEKMTAICRDLGIGVIDLSRRWQQYQAESAEPARTSFKTDPHYNEVGHRLIAEGYHAELERIRVADAEVKNTASR